MAFFCFSKILNLEYGETKKEYKISSLKQMYIHIKSRTMRKKYTESCRKRLTYLTADSRFEKYYVDPSANSLNPDEINKR